MICESASRATFCEVVRTKIRKPLADMFTVRWLIQIQAVSITMLFKESWMRSVALPAGDAACRLIASDAALATQAGPAVGGVC